MYKGVFVLSLTALICLAETSSHIITKAEIDKWMTGECSNWGRWGKTDQLGAVHLITDAKRREAAGLVHEGTSISLAHNPLTEKAPDNDLPFRHTMLSTGQHPNGPYVMDEYAVSYHGVAHTHMDSLCHMAWNGKMYNGFPQTDVTDRGAKELAITNYKNGIFTRGVLFDIPRLKGKQWLEPGEAIYPGDLDAWLKKTGVTLEPGDVVFIRTGRWARREAKGAAGNASSLAGLYATCAPWLKKRDVVMVGSDSDTDVVPSGIKGVEQPMHQLLLVAMGTPMFDNCDLEELGNAAEQRKRWTFLVSAAPIPVNGGTGSPLNPIATF